MTGVYEQLRRDIDSLQWPRAAKCFASLADEAQAAEWSRVEYLQGWWPSRRRRRSTGAWPLEAEAVLVGGSRGLFLGVRVDQRGVDVDHVATWVHA